MICRNPKAKICLCRTCESFLTYGRDIKVCMNFCDTCPVENCKAYKEVKPKEA